MYWNNVKGNPNFILKDVETKPFRTRFLEHYRISGVMTTSSMPALSKDPRLHIINVCGTGYKLISEFDYREQLYALHNSSGLLDAAL